MLQIARCFFQCFANPDGQTWVHAFHWAQSPRMQWNGPEVLCRIQDTVSAMGHARSSNFNFSNPLCNECCRIVTAHERLLMACIILKRAGQTDKARAQAMLLCESNPVEELLDAVGRLVEALPAVEPVS